jgi:hypothetical protein
MKPYKDIEVTDKYIIREFNENIDPIELLWHRDDESRTVEIIGETDWKVQLDNELPTSLNESIFIPRHHWHRVIKGNGNLKLKIYKNGQLDLRKFLYNNTLLNEDEKEDLEKSYKKGVKSFRSDLAKYISDPKVKAILDGSKLADGDENDDKLPFTSAKVAVKKLIPTQKEIGFDQSVKGNLDDEYGSLDGILKGNVNVGGPIVTYAGKYIIDGHHKWSTVFAANPGANMDALDIVSQSRLSTFEIILKALHSAIAVDRNKVANADPKGANILTGINYPGVLSGTVEKYFTPEAEDVC